VSPEFGINKGLLQKHITSYWRMMMEFPKALKSWINALEKICIIGTLLLAMSSGGSYIKKKTEQASALKKEAEKRISIINTLTNTYVSQLNKIDNDIRELDKAIEKEVWSTTTGAENKYRIRGEKVKDKQELLNNLGNQIIEFQRHSVIQEK
jgi:hypothetical protein